MHGELLELNQQLVAKNLAREKQLQQMETKLQQIETKVGDPRFTLALWPEYNIIVYTLLVWWYSMRRAARSSCLLIFL